MVEKQRQKKEELTKKKIEGERIENIYDEQQVITLLFYY